MKKVLLLTALLFVSLFAAAKPAKAYPIPGFCIFSAFGNGSQILSYLQYGQIWGYNAWACPAPGTFTKYRSTMRKQWQSTCPQGGETVVGISINGPNPYYPPDTIITINSAIYDPTNGRNLGIYDWEAVVYNVNTGTGNIWLPTLDPVDLYGPVACDPYAHTTGDQSVPQ